MVLLIPVIKIICASVMKCSQMGHGMHAYLKNIVFGYIKFSLPSKFAHEVI